ncbi:uncharacterized protein LOC130644891 [Hydractinia symbiolongicarpus]|uniref:uncharacterized protein LOC130644891 n=1 Tax=Hydractinia symbiolongicarpus TaxID=13093 RepID=UPI00254DF7B9|nr:uncharacterized protein LOC130644891 [Hydractinia symbiolongicarpus]
MLCFLLFFNYNCYFFFSLIEFMTSLKNAHVSHYLYIYSQASKSYVQIKNGRLNAEGNGNKYSVFIKEIDGRMLLRLRSNHTGEYICLDPTGDRFILQKKHRDSTLCLLFQDPVIPTRYTSTYNRQRVLAFNRFGALRNNKFILNSISHRSVLFLETPIIRRFTKRVCKCRCMNSIDNFFSKTDPD